MASSVMTQEQFNARCADMMKALSGFITDGKIVIDGKTYTVEKFGEKLMYLKGKRNATYMAVTMPKVTLIGKPGAMVFSLSGSGGRDCGKFAILADNTMVAL